MMMDHIIRESSEKAYRLEFLFLSQNGSKYPALAERLENLRSDHDKMKEELMTKLGFSNPRIQKVGITPNFKT